MTAAAAPASPPPAAPSVRARAAMVEGLAHLPAQLKALDELTGHALALTGALARQASGDRDEPLVEGDIALAFARVGRVINQAVLLQLRLIKAAGRDGGLIDAGLDDEQDEDAAAEDDRRDRVLRIVRRIGEGQVCEAEADRLDRLDALAIDRLDDEDLYGDVMQRPVSELVDRLCKDLGLEPDWPALSQELWARRELQSDAPGAPLAAAMRQAAAASSPEGGEGAFSPTNSGSGVPP